jgi:hypothetical protein
MLLLLGCGVVRQVHCTCKTWPDFKGGPPTHTYTVDNHCGDPNETEARMFAAVETWRCYNESQFPRCECDCEYTQNIDCG